MSAKFWWSINLQLCAGRSQQQTYVQACYNLSEIDSNGKSLEVLNPVNIKVEPKLVWLETSFVVSNNAVLCIILRPSQLIRLTEEE